jgi:hypothetical protein
MVPGHVVWLLSAWVALAALIQPFSGFTTGAIPRGMLVAHVMSTRSNNQRRRAR